MKSSDTGLKRILKAFTYSYSGFKESFKSEAAFRQELFLCIVLFVIVFFLPASMIERLLLIGSLFLVLLMELVNTAIEVVVDRISDEKHHLSKKAKDIGSLLVLTSFTYLFIVWSAVLYRLFF